MSTSTTKTKDMVTTAMFVAIILAMSFVPYLGYIPLGFMNATIIHIPVIIGARCIFRRYFRTNQHD